jgi:hypothetical protein
MLRPPRAAVEANLANASADTAPRALTFSGEEAKKRQV